MQIATAVSENERERRAKQSSEDKAKRLAWRVNDACGALGISRSHFYDLAAAGKIRLVKIGGRTVVHDAEVQRLASEGA
ncbi:helix-turn-helix transcriptional regulator [Methylocystis parvus]|uniref:helix-turn-helix transcriptional regulator n=1 Tax=Methylocystis parvus TaxID=134 RepID=UPI003C71BC1B